MVSPIVSCWIGAAIFWLTARASPIVGTDDTDQVIRPTEHPEFQPRTCLNLTVDQNCSICFDSVCPIAYEEILASFGNELFSAALVETGGLRLELEDTNVSLWSGNTTGCPQVDVPRGEAEYGCMYVPNIGRDGCIRCYSYTCLQCNVTEVPTNASSISEEEIPTNDAGTSTPSTNPDNCPLVAPQSNEHSPNSQDCIYVPQRGSDGCIQSYDLICPQNPSVHVNHAPTKTGCPLVRPPANKTAVGCIYAEHFDKKGCIVAYDMICSTPLAELNPGKPSNHKQGHGFRKNPQQTVYDWRIMLGDSYRGAASKDARKFRPKASVAIPSSGRFVACKRQTDCFQYREPKEWCAAASANSSTYAWTDKSCYCAHDTEKRTCLIERVNLKTKVVEWTFCSPKKNFNCT